MLLLKMLSTSFHVELLDISFPCAVNFLFTVPVGLQVSLEGTVGIVCSHSHGCKMHAQFKTSGVFDAKRLRNQPDNRISDWHRSNGHRS